MRSRSMSDHSFVDPVAAEPNNNTLVKVNPLDWLSFINDLARYIAVILACFDFT